MSNTPTRGGIGQVDAVARTTAYPRPHLFRVVRVTTTKQNPGDMREAQRHIRGLRERL